MASNSSRLRFGTAVASAFLGGIVLTAAFDLTPFGFAQQTGAPKPTAAEVQSLAETSNAFVSIAEHVTPAVVSISAETDASRSARGGRRPALPPGWDDFLRQFGQPPQQQQQQPQQSSGTGFIVSKDGYILTNNHVIEDADRLIVRTNEGKSYRATLVGRDPDTDVAVIKIDGGSNLPAVTLGDDGKLRIGEWVVAIGNPLGLDFTVTAGIVSAKGRDVQDLPLPNWGEYSIVDLIQTDAAINPGNSGGPLVNIRGEVIGINNAIASQTGYFAGYGFAIPITLAKDVMEDLIKYGRTRRAVIGVSIGEVNADDAAVAGLDRVAGAKIGDFNGEDSPARRAGLEPNDVIVAVNGQPVDRVSTLQRLIRAYEPGTTVKLTVMRYGDRREFDVRLAEAPAREAQVARAPVARPDSLVTASSEKLGVAVAPVTAEWSRSLNLSQVPAGVLVTEVLPDGPARERLVARIDVIQEVIHPDPRREIRTVADLQAALRSLRAGEYVSLRVYNARAQQHRIVNMRIGG